MPPRKGEEILVFKIGKEQCCFAVTGPAGKQLYELAYYTAEEINGNFFNQLLELHPELEQPFLKTLVSYDYPQSVLIPSKYFKQENASSVLKTLQGVDSSAAVITETVLENKLLAVYAVPAEVRNWMLTKFPTATYSHCYTVGIKNLPNDNAGSYIRMDFSTRDFSIIVSKDDQLLMAQTFPYSAPGDVIYYLIKTCGQFSLSPSEVKLVLSGLIEMQSALFRELYQYFIYINFKNADWVVNQDNEYPMHFFAFLNEVIQCES